MSLPRCAAALVGFTLAIAPVCASAQTAAVPTLQVVAGARIAAIADRSARAAVPDSERALAPAFRVGDVSVAAGTVGLTAGPSSINPTYVSVPVAISIDGRVTRTVYAGYRITTYVRSAVAARDLPGDSIVGLDDVVVTRVPFAGRTAYEPASFIGRRVRATIARGAVLYPELTAVNEIVRAGMPALLIVHDGPVKLAADVVARTGGGLGDYVTIFNPQTQKALSGVVVGPNTVELTLPGGNE